MQSVEVGAALLRALADADGPVPLGALARAAGMPSAKAHRYLVSFVQAGLVVQSERSGTYDLGPLAVHLGLAAIARSDVVRAAGERLSGLRDELDGTVSIAVWTDAGPAVARIELSRQPVTLAVRVGTTYPLRTTATGRVFLAYSPAAEAMALAADPGEREAIAALQEDVRAHGVATAVESFLVGVCAMALPLFGHDGALAGAVTVVGWPGELDLAPDGTTASTLRRFAAAGGAGPR
ncbi:MAG: helix-turn-helix domain-containing protein [Vulcanimicrobiaceae bacterium]